MEPRTVSIRFTETGEELKFEDTTNTLEQIDNAVKLFRPGEKYELMGNDDEDTELRAIAKQNLNNEGPECSKCGDEGIIEVWGPNDGCKEFMTAPEATFYCSCKAGRAALKADEEWGTNNLNL